MSLRPLPRSEIRKKSYKSGVDIAEARRRREGHLVVIRKNRREDSLAKRRRDASTPVASSSFSLPGSAHTRSFDDNLESLPAMVQGVLSDDIAMQLDAVTRFRRLLSIKQNPPIEEVVKSGVISRFVEFLSMKDLPQLQFEAAWTLTNISSGTTSHTRAVIENGAVPKFVELLNSPCDDIREQAVWALGNIAGDSPHLRDIILENGGLLPLLSQFSECSKISMIRNATWTLSNFCRGKPPAPFEQIKPSLPVLQCLIHSNDKEVLADACWALSYLSDGTNDKIQAVIEAGVCPRLVDLLLHPSPAVLTPTLRTVGNIVTGDDIQTQFMLNNGILSRLHQLIIQDYNKNIKKEVCWTISNVTAGNRYQIQAVIDANIIKPLIQLLRHAEFDVKKEAAWAITNVTSGGSNDQIHFLVSQQCIEPLCDLLTSPDLGIVTVCLEGLENILKVGEADQDSSKNGGVNLYAQMIDSYGGLDKIENLQSHDDNEIYERTIKMLERYWVEENDGEVIEQGDQLLGF